jgi:hypothetical protein
MCKILKCSKYFTCKLPQKFVSKILQHLIAECREIIVTKFREMNVNFVVISYFAKKKYRLSYPPYLSIREDPKTYLFPQN